MGVRNRIGIAVGLDCAEAKDTAGRSILDLHAVGELPESRPSDGSLWDLAEWFVDRYGEVAPRSHGPRPFEGILSGAIGHSGHGRIIVGILACDTDATSPSSTAGPLTESDLDKIAQSVQESLAEEFAVYAEPLVYLRWSAE